LQIFPWENITLEEPTCKFDLKSKFSAEEFYKIKYDNKTPPCKLEEFIQIYNAAPSFTKLKDMLHEAVHTVMKNTPF